MTILPNTANSETSHQAFSTDVNNGLVWRSLTVLSSLLNMSYVGKENLKLYLKPPPSAKVFDTHNCDETIEENVFLNWEELNCLLSSFVCATFVFYSLFDHRHMPL